MPEEELVLRVVDVKKSFGTEVVTEVLRGSSFDLRRAVSNWRGSPQPHSRTQNSPA